MLKIAMLRNTFFHHYADYRNAECPYAECRQAECRFADCRSAGMHTDIYLLIPTSTHAFDTCIRSEMNGRPQNKLNPYVFDALLKREREGKKF